MRVFVKIVALVAVYQCLMGQGILYSSASGVHFMASILVPKEQFSDQYLRSVAAGYLRRRDFSVIALFFAVDASEMRHFWNAKMVDNMPYVLWRDAYNLRVEDKWLAADFIGLRGSGLLSIRNANGQVRRIVIGTRDKSGLLSADVPERILQVRVTSVPATDRKDVTFWIQTNQELGQSTGRRLLSILGDLPFDEVWVKVRNDPWFISDAAFPVFDIFQPGLTPPTHDEYWRSKTMVCSNRTLNSPTGACTVYSAKGGAPVTTPIRQ